MARITKNLIGISRHSATGKVLKVADIALKAGVNISTGGSPIADALYEISKTGIGKIREYVHARDDKRILEFHQHLLYRDELLDEEMLSAELEEANFHALMQACLSDIEDEKTVPYALLTRAIALGKIKSELRRHYILALKEMAWDHLDFLRKAYVISSFSIIPDQGPGELTAEKFLTNYIPWSVEHLAVVGLSAKGFVDGVQLSELGKDFVKACSTVEDLTPQVYELNVWSGHKCEIIILDDAGLSLSLGQQIQDNLRAKRVACSGGIAMEGALRRHESNIYASCVILVFRRGKQLEPNILANLQHRVGKKPVVQLVLDSDGDETPERLVDGEVLVVNSAATQLGAKLVVEELIAQINSRSQKS
ncbi:hypothetical protein [Pseudomonas sp. G2-4]|uniref:hypothetical protein n=1 Tax=Pseudomonas sp. G2-4 TaxID=1506334 RepID=UPI0024BA5CA8|nr:hypothetical protein [Pseudomonas sp. G2-4]WHS58629.1 hypothetical protein QNH97_19455 [Pseudomonas sp. G2-4]